MDLKGKIIAVLPVKEGTSSRGPWKSQEYVLETQEEYTQKAVFSIFGDEKINNAHIQVGDMVEVSFNFKASNYNGRWFNALSAWRVHNFNKDVSPERSAPSPTPQPNTAPPKQPATEGSADDLPF